MKYSIALCLFALCMAGPASAQHEQVVEVPGASAIELYHRSERWFVDTFKDANSVIQIRDSTQKMMVGKGFVTIYVAYGKGLTAGTIPTPTSYSVETKCKDGRCKFMVYDLGLVLTSDCEADMTQYPEAKTGTERKVREAYPAMYKQQCSQLKALVERLTTSYRASLTSVSKDDW